MRLIVGLGNPGEKYNKNRHNVGFILLDDLVFKSNEKWSLEKKFECLSSRVGDDIFVKPQTYMNRSGESVAKVMEYYNVPIDKLIVIHDDVDIEAGKVKIQSQIGSAGHKGVQNIIDTLKTLDFTRIRVGIGRPSDYRMDIEDWVLMNFEKSVIEKLIDNVDIKAIIDDLRN
jgi:PTH1 family peptidyl-tRNA hydrolase